MIGVKGRKDLLFVNKKKQKNFMTLGHGRWRWKAHAQKSRKFFGSFFQKRTASETS
jgi:hypothetical protein